MPADQSPSIKRQSTIFRSQRWQKDHSRPVTKIAPLVAPMQEGGCRSCMRINGTQNVTLQDKYQSALQKFRDAELLNGTTVVDAVASPRSLGYRAHAKLAVRAASADSLAKDGKRFAIGLFEPESHKLVHLDPCPLHRESINRLLPDLQEELEASALEPYFEAAHTGDLRYLAIRAAHKTEELMLTFVVLDEKYRVELKAMVLRLRQKGHVIVSAHMNVHPLSSNAIFGPLTKKLVGADGLRESLCGLTFEIGPTSFFQVNPWQAESIYRRVEALAGSAQTGDVAWDLYCGTGQISLLLSQQGYRTLGIEENPQATDDARANAVRNRLQGPDYIAGRVEDLEGRLPDWSERPALIVANPSRRGLAAAARKLIMDGLNARPEARLLYVSCEADSLIRDLAEICKDGRKLRQLECFDMFPFTGKLEWIAVVQ